MAAASAAGGLPPHGAAASFAHFNPAMLSQAFSHHLAQPPAWLPLVTLGLGALSLVSLVMVSNVQQRVQSLETELKQRQQVSQEQATEAKVMAKRAQDLVSDSSGRLGLVEARVAESAMQRTQVEELIQSLSRSRDENVVADVESALRVAVQQTAITGSAEPLLAALKQADERLARHNQPRLDRVRRAVLHDLERVRAVGAVDVASLAIKLEELARLVDALALVSQPVGAASQGGAPLKAATGGASRVPGKAQATASAASAAAEPTLWGGMREQWQGWTDTVWREVRGLVRVTRIDKPEAMLISPDQAFFLRENIKLRLFNARLSLLSRQFDLAQSDLAQVQTVLNRYFDRNTRQVQNALELVGVVVTQSRQVSVPRPDETFAALAAAAAGR